MNHSTLAHIFISNIKKQKTAFSLLVITSLFWAIQQSIMPWAMRYMVNIMYSMKSNAHNKISIGNTLITFTSIFVISEIIIRSQGVFIAMVLPKFRANIKLYFISNLLSKNYLYFLDEMPGNITQKINDISSSAERIVHIVIYNFLTIISSLLLTAGFLFSIEPLYAFLIITWFSIHVITTSLRLKKSLHKTKVHNKIHGSICSSLCEIVSKISLVKTCSGKNHELIKMSGLLLKESLTLVKSQLFFEKAKVLQSIVSITFILALITHQIFNFNQGTQSIGDFIFVVFATVSLTNYVWFSSFQLTVFAREYGTMKDAYEALSKGEDDAYDSNVQTDNNPYSDSPNLAIKQMSYTFSNGSKIIDNHSLDIHFGEKIILQGKSGIGKSTLAKILVGLYADYSGDIFIGDKQLNSFSREMLSRLIMLVEQRPLLFNRTIRENICYGNVNYTEAQLESALHVSCCYDFINSLDNGLDTILGENGFSLSGGQTQRISIARAVLFNPKILILDESTSGLDQELERKVINNLMNIKNQTLLVISHSIELLSIIPNVVSFTPIHNKQSIEEGNLLCPI